MTTGGVVSKRAEKQARCAGWRKLSYAVKGTSEEGHGDTTATIGGIRVHNKTGSNKGCWK